MNAIFSTFNVKILASKQGFDPSLVPYVKLEPARSYLHPGDSIAVDCKSSSPDSTVTWKREGDRMLPSNIHVSMHTNAPIIFRFLHFYLCFFHFLPIQQQGIQLIITNAKESDAGRYICVCRTGDGQESESEYELNVETPPARNEVKPPQVI